MGVLGAWGTQRPVQGRPKEKNIEKRLKHSGPGHHRALTAPFPDWASAWLGRKAGLRAMAVRHCLQKTVLMELSEPALPQPFLPSCPSASCSFQAPRGQDIQGLGLSVQAVIFLFPRQQGRGVTWAAVFPPGPWKFFFKFKFQLFKIVTLC